MPEGTFTYEDLIGWSEGLPAWQRDALRRILRSGSLEGEDIEELVVLAQGGEGGPEPIPATLGDVRPSGPSRERVSLLRIADIERVNALSKGPISFGAEGLTVVYGDNAAGKSGVARILKKACRARDPGGAILPSLHDEAPGPPAQAQIYYQVDDEKRDTLWIAETPSASELGQVHVFDAACADVQVEKPNRISYTPEILAAFQALVGACESVKRKLEGERTNLGGTPPELLGVVFQSAESGPSKLLSALTGTTDPERVRALSDISEEERTRAGVLREALGDDPLRKAQDAEVQLRDLDSLEAKLNEVEELLSDDGLEELETACDEEREALQAANAARETFAENSELPDIGGEIWRKLWEAARSYSESLAYPASPFPMTAEDALCVLCQQPLDPASRDRLDSFEVFVTSDLEQKADTARAFAADARSKRNDLELPTSWKACRLAGVELDSPEGLALEFYLVRAKLRRRAAFLSTPPPQLPERPRLETLREGLRTAAAELRRAANEDSRREMELELVELDDRMTLSPLRPAILREVQRKADVQELNTCIQDCDTGRITRKEGEAAKSILTGRLRSALQTNLSRVGYATTGVDVVLGQGEKAVHPYRFELMARKDVRPGDILSEGERTCVALAGFLAELEATRNVSGIVLDDPVTSLDHRYREHVAERLCEEAEHRQVIVFTHDVVFLWMLRKHASQLHITQKELSLEQGFKVHGVVREGPPWVAMPVGKRIKRLQHDLRQAEALLHDEDRPGYEREAKGVYERLRETWERAVEEKLLYQVVQRFSTDIQTSRLRVLSDITDADIERVTREMTRCSNYGHDDAGAVNRGIPEPEIVRGDIKKLESWVEDLEKRGRR